MRGYKLQNLGLRQVTTYTDRNIANVKFNSLSCVTGPERVRFPEHVIVLVENITETDDIWQGSTLPRNYWRPGSVAFLPANSELMSAPSRPYSATAIRLPERLFVDAAQHHIDFSRINFRYTEITDPATTPLATALRNMAANNDFHHWPMLVEFVALSVTIAAIRRLSPDATTVFRNLKNGLTNSRKTRVVEYVNSNLQEEITLEELARVAALSPHHFARSFKSSVGVSPMRFVWQRRVDAAKRMMIKASIPLAMVALGCGFSSQSHFTTVFKASTGVTPAAYRRAMLE